MTPAIALLLIGGVLIVAARRRDASIVNTILGREDSPPEKDVAGVTDATGSSDTPTAAASSIGSGTGLFQGRRIAKWIIPELKWARDNGWTGKVTSGYRSPAMQAALWNNRANNQYPVARPGQSEHGKTDFPHGAVDVSNPDQLASVLSKKPGGSPLKRGVPSDPIHFSGTGH